MSTTKYMRIAIPGGHCFNGCLIARTAKKLLPALDRSMRSRYARHIGKKQKAKAAKRQLSAA